MITPYSLDDNGHRNHPNLRKWTLLRGTEITEIQRDLSFLGYPIAIDGAFGNKTKAFLSHFQRSNPKIKDELGVFGDLTKKTLDKAVRELTQLGVKEAPSLYEYYKSLVVRDGYKWKDDELNLIGLKQFYYEDARLGKYDDFIIVAGKGNMFKFNASIDAGEMNGVKISSNQQLQFKKGLFNDKYPCLVPKDRVEIRYSMKGINYTTKGKFPIMAGGDPFQDFNSHSSGNQLIASPGGWGSSIYKFFLDLTYYNQEQEEFNYSVLDLSKLLII